MIRTGAEQVEHYLPMILDKKVGIVANQTSVIGKVNLVDTLAALGIHITAIFTPEHGAGVSVDNTTDGRTGIPIISLYGSKRKPEKEDVRNIEVMIYDIQDLGVRFYTYISTLHYVMEACAENHIPLIVLDRPDPNGHYVDGPVLEPEFSSFVGMHPIPVVYGMTVGELARMINGEGWLSGGSTCDLKIIPCRNYTHQSKYDIPVNPSPNITSMEAVYLYPSLCFFEGTVMSVGRGTRYPFRIFGSPDYPDHSFSFTPQPNTGNSDPLNNGQTCYGVDLTNLSSDSLFNLRRINLQWIKAAYDSMAIGDKFFNGYFNTLAGTRKLKEQIEAGLPEDVIRAGWQPALETFMQMRQQYLLYE